MHSAQDREARCFRNLGHIGGARHLGSCCLGCFDIFLSRSDVPKSIWIACDEWQSYMFMTVQVHHINFSHLLIASWGLRGSFQLMKLHQKMDNLLAHWQLMHCAADTKCIMNLCKTHSDKIGICMNLLDPRRSWENVTRYWESCALMNRRLWHGQVMSSACCPSPSPLHPLEALEQLFPSLPPVAWRTPSSSCLVHHSVTDWGKRLGTMIVNLYRLCPKSLLY